MTNDPNRPKDPWADWLLRGRQQGMSERELRRQDRALHGIRDRTLRAARLRKGQRVLDVGAGTGLLALDACRRVGPDGFVCGLDISHVALEEALRLGAGNPSNADLTAGLGDAAALPFADASFDVVLTRSVLIYVADKTAAAREFFRVLRPGGRVSIFEPINSVAMKYQTDGGRDLSAVQPDRDRVRAYQEALWPHKGAMMDFDERDLVQWFVAAGFAVKLTYLHFEGRGRQLTAREQARYREQVVSGLARRGNPTMLSYAEAAEAVLGSDAAAHLDRMTDLMLTQPRMNAWATAYLVAQRPKR